MKNFPESIRYSMEGMSAKCRRRFVNGYLPTNSRQLLPGHLTCYSTDLIFYARSSIYFPKGVWNGSRPVLEDRLCCRRRESPVLRSAGAASASGRAAPSLPIRLGTGRGLLGLPGSIRNIGNVFFRSEEIIFDGRNNRTVCSAVVAPKGGYASPIPG